MVKAPMTKDLLMQYTLVALFVIAFLSYFVFGLQALLVCGIAGGVAVLCDMLMAKVMGSKAPKDMMSAAVFGLIVGLSYSLGEPMMALGTVYPVLAGGLEMYLYPALISAVGLIVFKKLAGLAGRKYVNPAAVAKLLVLGLLFLPMLTNVNVLIPEDHTISIDLTQPLTEEVFSNTLVTCYGHPTDVMTELMMGGSFQLDDAVWTMMWAKYHGWIGGFSSLLVIGVGLGLFFVCRGYIKWRITLSYLLGTAVVAAVMSAMYVGAAPMMNDMILRIVFHLFMGSSIFLAFFMATDPATTPMTHTGQLIFGVGLAVLTIVIQTYTGFLGGSILALVIMNLTCPVLDHIGAPKGTNERRTVKLPKVKKVGSPVTTACIRCGQCLTACPMNIPSIFVKNAADKGDWAKAKELGAGYCIECGQCSLVCPARIDLKGAVVSAKGK
ncbi:MAG: RnfABCDGE type electron transport complex subunit D [Candidatus Bathyarchaeota archaeon]|nr:RnfABCDGE type electron transport complex subunit D [Candidatus Bathyarchaeum tardum]WGM90007.1 MAG: RnfABCDGE type electron transport complex subunit D [Candidatus Bathyarchaeum tardum]WNZ29853.1 MAG: RnfABCDGE type electron transport complex subunit D [Candidatus Bathyarchaeota archaeon]